LNAAAVFLPGRFGGVSIPPTANACTPHRAPADLPADLASCGSGHADTANPSPARSASVGDLGGDAVQRRKRRGRHGLRRRCDGQGKGSNSDQPDHSLSPMFQLLEKLIMPCPGRQRLTEINLCQGISWNACSWPEPASRSASSPAAARAAATARSRMSKAISGVTFSSCTRMSLRSCGLVQRS
jgi:hypothetical protein